MSNGVAPLREFVGRYPSTLIKQVRWSIEDMFEITGHSDAYVVLISMYWPEPTDLTQHVRLSERRNGVPRPS